jgi:hypothetical protein
VARILATAVFILLALPALLFAPFAFLLLDAPWASNGLGAVIAWLIILCCWAIALTMIFAAKATWQWRWPFYRAALFPKSDVAMALAILSGSALPRSGRGRARLARMDRPRATATMCILVRVGAVQGDPTLSARSISTFRL